MIGPDPTAEKFSAAVRRLYGPRVERIVLYGSRARGDARPDSDYDIAVFLHDLTNRWQEMDRLAEIELDILASEQAVVHATPRTAGSWRERSPLMHEIREDGLDL
jgi:predicted nucleotidyltransferase